MESGHDHGALTAIAVVALAALACGLFMQRARQPALVGYILAGILLGPSGVGLVENRDAIRLLAELGVLLLLYLIGMELSIRGIREVWKIAVFTTGIQIGASMAVMLLGGYVLGWPLPPTLLLSFVVALSSTAVAIKMLEEIGELRTRVGQVTVAVLIAQDLAVVPMMLIVGSFDEGGGIGLDALVKVLISVGFLVMLIVYLGRRKTVQLPFAAAIHQNHDLAPLAGLAFCFCAAAISGLVGLSAAYGAFLAGLIIGNSTSRKIMLEHMPPIQSILLMVFFLSVGLLVDLGFIWDHFAAVIAIVAFIALFKTALNIWVIRMLGETWPRAILSGVLLAQIGEFSFILAGLGLSLGAVSPETHRLIVAVTVLSLIASPFWLMSARRIHRAALLGITSGRETLRVTYGNDLAALLRATIRAETRVVDLLSGVAAWIGDRVPRRAGDGPGPEADRPEAKDAPEKPAKPEKPERPAKEGDD